MYVGYNVDEMKIKNKLLVFDVDDTLLQSEGIHQSAFVAALNEEGVKVVDTDWASYKHHTDSYIAGVNYQNQFGKAMSNFDLIMIEAAMIEYLSTYQKASEVIGAAAMIAQLWKKSEYAIAFATGSLREPALMKLEEAGIRCEEAVLVGSNEYHERETIVSKAIEAAQDYYKVERFEEVIAFGDGPWDYKTAEALQIKFIGVGAKYREWFKEQGVKLCIEDFENFGAKTLDAFLAE